jgi:hypothetical protein
MNEIICPHCKKAFTIDEASYADILQQVRNHEFEEELSKREKQLKKEKDDAVMLAEERAKNAFKDQLSEKERQYFELKADKDNQLTELQGRLNAFETEKALAVTEALNQVEKERDRLANELATEKKLKESELQSLEAVYKEKLTEEIKLKDAQLKDKDELIERYKDMKAKLSTKMIGETLEQHCEMEFNKLRPTAFPQSYFEKDNDSSTGTKGDYIYREKDHEDNEIISIMFEMKNESDDAAKKQKIESHFKKLDEDRNKKGCEYAVMVTLLEADNELYNTGIVDVSYRYPKMYVIRPQFFIPMITLLRNAAMNSVKYKAELAQIRNQNIDITNFEEELNSFKQAFGKRYLNASERFKDAVNEIDKSIKSLQNVKDNLVKSEEHFRIANQKAEDLTIKRLTKGNPTMTEMFNNVKEKD